MVINNPMALFVGQGIVDPVSWPISKYVFILLQITLKYQFDMVFSPLFPLINQYVLGLLFPNPEAELGGSPK